MSSVRQIHAQNGQLLRPGVHVNCEHPASEASAIHDRRSMSMMKKHSYTSVLVLGKVGYELMSSDKLVVRCLRPSFSQACNIHDIIAQFG